MNMFLVGTVKNLKTSKTMASRTLAVAGFSAVLISLNVQANEQDRVALHDKNSNVITADVNTSHQTQVFTGSNLSILGLCPEFPRCREGGNE